ncbi:flagellar filament capping protein FliD [Paenibacillus piscarius]|uniref:flagellar filament capping protein FliD n=1 Tax=Paenibacillus piscarius TaxID=1089681 RepID=UPI001EE81B88|nr:flagellar filament capping protein FliD [Paenibacillus piscarius]
MVTRINGFSGMDIDSMVKSMMAAKRVPLDKLNQDKQILQWTRESYREMNSKLYDFGTNKLTLKYGLSSALNAQKAVLSGNTTALKAEATANATGQEMAVKVTKLATRTTYETAGLGQGIPATTSLAALDGVDLGSMRGLDMEEYLKKGFDISINGETFKDKDGKSLFNGMTSISTLVATINSSAKANAIASYDEITGKLTIASKTGGKDGAVVMGSPASSNTVLGLFTTKKVVETNPLTDATLSTTLTQLTNQLNNSALTDDEVQDITFSINGKSFTFKGSDNISNVLTKINEDNTAKVAATFENGVLKLTGIVENPGNPEGAVKLSGNSYGFMKLFNEMKSNPADDNSITKKFDGVNAEVEINGEPIKDVTSNTFTINGIQLTLLEVTKANEPVIIKTQTDSAKAVESIKSFVEDYNNLILALNSKIDEAKYRDFRPLTDAQKAEMKEADVKTWTEKAQSGLLKNDDIIKSVLSEMRSIISNKLGPLSTLGITTGNYMSNGKLVINEEKLSKAINENPQLALDLFQGPASAPKEGIFDKMAEKITGAIEKISERAGTNRYSMDLTSTFKEESVMGKKLKLYNSRISVMTTMLNNTETRYYKQFSAMETAMNKLQSQSNSLFSTDN